MRTRDQRCARRGLLAVALGLALLSSLACSRGRADRIVIGSKNFTESLILSEIMAQDIEAHTSLKVERRFYLAGTYICHQAIRAGRIDIYPEYTGTALNAILKESGGDAAQVYERVKREYEQRFQLTLGAPFGFNDTFAMEIRGEDARRLTIKTTIAGGRVHSAVARWIRLRVHGETRRIPRAGCCLRPALCRTPARHGPGPARARSPRSPD